MEFDAVLEESRQFKGALGAVAYVVIRGLREGGVAEAEVEQVLATLRAGLKGLTDGQCDTLVHVLERRLEEVRQGGKLYELVKLTGRMNNIKAQLMHASLRQAGINARFNHAHLSDVFAGSDPDAEIWVPRNEVKRALALIDETPESPGAVTCPVCHETSPAHFGACWACGARLGEVTVPPAAPEP
jgi:hypothetical protein